MTAQGRRDDDRRRGTLDNGTRKIGRFKNALRVDLECRCRKLLGLVGASPADRRMRSSKTGRSGAANPTISLLIQLLIARKTPRRSSSALHDVLQLCGASFSHSRRPCPLISLHLAVSPLTVVPGKPRLQQLSDDTRCILRRPRSFDFDISSGEHHETGAQSFCTAAARSFANHTALDHHCEHPSELDHT